MSIPAIALGAGKLIVGAASTYAGVQGAKNQYERQAQHYEQNKQAAHDAYILDTHLRNKNLMQQRAATSQRKQDNSLKRLQAEGSALAAAAAGGVEGASVSQILDDFRRNEGVIEDRLDQNLEAREDQNDFELLGSQATAQGRANSVQIPSLDGVYSTAVRGAGNLLGEFSDFSDLFDGDFDV